MTLETRIDHELLQVLKRELPHLERLLGQVNDDLIAEREAKHGKRTTTDDGEDQWLPRGPRS